MSNVEQSINKQMRIYFLCIFYVYVWYRIFSFASEVEIFVAQLNCISREDSKWNECAVEGTHIEMQAFTNFIMRIWLDRWTAFSSSFLSYFMLLLLLLLPLHGIAVFVRHLREFNEQIKFAGAHTHTRKRISYELKQLMNWNKSMFSFWHWMTSSSRYNSKL